MKLNRHRLNRYLQIRTLWDRENLRAALLLIAVLHVCFFPYIWGNKTFLASSQDASSVLPSGAWAGKPVNISFPKVLDSGGPGFQTEPWFKLIGLQYWQKHTVPLWNPYQGYGVPLAANMQSQPFYPLSAALSFCLTPRTYNWYILLRLFVAGICMYLYLRFFVSFIPALAGSITSMLAGYYVLFITMPQLSVEIMLPVSLWAGEHLLRRPGYRTLTWFSVAVSLVLLGGMPESSLMVLTFIYLYLLFRITSDKSLRGSWKDTTLRLALSTVVGIGLSVFLLLPLGEFLTRSYDSHQSANIGGVVMGVQHDPFGISIFTYFFPLLTGPLFTNPLGPDRQGLRNYISLVGVLLIVVAVAGLFRKEERRQGSFGPLTCFCAVYLLATVLKRYGFPPINIIGYLPLYKLVWFAKYGEVAVSACVSILCAIGLERFVRSQVSYRTQVAALGLAFLLIPLALACSWRTLMQEVSAWHVRATIPLTAVAVPVCALFCAALVFILFSRERLDTVGYRATNRRLSVALLSLLSAELILNYIAPVYYFFNKIPNQAHNAYAGAPYLRVLKKEAADRYRIFAKDAVLFPNWAAAFELFDIRNLDAIYYKKYLPFVRNFISGKAADGDLIDRFVGTGDYDISAPSAQRLLQISSVKYIGSMRPFGVSNTILEDVLRQNQQLLASGASANVGRRDLAIRGDAREGLGEHPPYARLPYRLQVGNARTFRFSYALDPAVFDKTASDGVGFSVEVETPSGAISKVFSNYIDPKHNPSERRWMDGAVDLSKYQGQSIRLLFSTDPGPKGDSAFDWAAWSNFQLDGGPARNNRLTASALPFTPIYEGEVRVYRYEPEVLPRAAIYYRADIRTGDQEVLRRLADSNLDVFQTVVVDASTSSAEQQMGFAEVNRGQPRREQPAKITSYQSQSVSIEATLHQRGILVLNDSDYPGWTVDIDGRPETWFTANYMFRGVLLSPGKHTVRFVYRPKSFYYGVAVSAATLLSLLGFGLARRLFQSPRAPRRAAEYTQSM
ncbi:MAG: YfhO family protein [Acidobacteriaceae bacterium]|nr:YfhO family protein [Acidobacteriaceae bacterium]